MKYRNFSLHVSQEQEEIRISVERLDGLMSDKVWVLDRSVPLGDQIRDIIQDLDQPFEKWNEGAWPSKNSPRRVKKK